MQPMRRAVEGKSIDEIRRLNSMQLQLPCTMEDFKMAYTRVSKSVSADDVKRYEEWMKEFRAE